jgi:hypothetical protein
MHDGLSMRDPLGMGQSYISAVGCAARSRPFDRLSRRGLGWTAGRLAGAAFSVSLARLCAGANFIFLACAPGRAIDPLEDSACPRLAALREPGRFFGAARPGLRRGRAVAQQRPAGGLRPAGRGPTGPADRSGSGRRILGIWRGLPRGGRPSYKARAARERASRAASLECGSIAGTVTF